MWVGLRTHLLEIICADWLRQNGAAVELAEMLKHLFKNPR